MFISLRRVDVGLVERVLYPVVPVLVTAEYDGRVGGMLAAWWMQASFNPPILVVAIAPERYTYKLVRESGVFAFNLLDYSLVDRTPYLGDVSERFLHGKLEKAGFSIIRGEALGAPIIGEAVAAVELKLMDVVRAGDHDLFLGESVSLYVSDDFRDGMWKLESYRPLLYLGRTRRPGPVYRVYLTARGWERREIEYGDGEKLKPLVERRIAVMGKVVDIVKRASSYDEALREVKGLLEREGLEEDDAEYLIEEAKRRLSK